MSPLLRRAKEPGVDAVLALGSNLGDRDGTIGAAIADLDSLREVRVSAISPLYETAAMTDEGVDEEAPRYLNGVVVVRTTLDPHPLLDAIHTIERGHGRLRAEHWGDRTLDIDIVAYGALEMHDATLTLPHPRAWERAWVLQPWLDIDPHAALPGYGPVAELRALASDVVVRWAGDARGRDA